MLKLAPSPTFRPTVAGRHYMASTGHPLATAAAVRILEAGGNAIDAGVAAGLCLNVVQPEYTNLGGVAPIMLYRVDDGQVRTISGLGCWPSSITPDHFTKNHGGDMPIGVERSVIPAAADAWMTALKAFGTKTLAEVAAPAIALAEDGFPTYLVLQRNLNTFAERMAPFATNASTFLRDGHAPEIGETITQPDLAKTLRLLVETESANQHLGREAAIQAARDRFYTGDIADTIAQFVAERGGFITKDDLAAFSVEIETAVTANYRGNNVFACRPWCQGPVVLEALNILQGYDLGSLSHNSADALHLILEALKAAFADRERFYGDPNQVDVPIDGLLDPGYAEMWRGRIDLDHAFTEMPEPGDPWRFEDREGPVRGASALEPNREAIFKADTSYLCVVDEEGNAFSATPSDGVGSAEVIPGLGFIVSDRGVQSRSEPGHPSSIAPGRRPRLTPSPGLIMRDGKVISPYGTPGGDVQPQAMVQFVVNLIDFGMEPQAALEAPRVSTFNYPESFYPFPYRPGLVLAESRLSDDVLEELRRRGHLIELWPDWAQAAGSLCAVVVDEKSGALLGAADPRRTGYAFGW
jgi:gamma-glutamyltranspeptidase/glutathione hydrolase